MSGFPHDSSAPAETDRLIAHLAISWFDLDAKHVEEMLRAAGEKHHHGVAVDFLGMLCEARLLTPAQADNIRQGQAPTRIDVGQPKAATANVARPKTNAKPRPGSDPTQMGPYRVLRRLGQGGMGAVYLGFDPATNRQVAIKVLDPEHEPKHNILQRFQREGQHGAMLTHTNIVRTLSMGQDEALRLHYIVLEFVDGPNAHDVLEREGRLKVGDALHIILDIARALEHAHKNQIIHRDIKPSNILITSAGLAKLSDLGLAKRRDDPGNLTHATQGIGTPYYMPYEQAINAKRADERSDIYALGATLFHLVTGEVPFAGKSSLEIVEKKAIGYYAPAGALNPEVPSKLENILARMLARNPEDRYQTVSEVIVDIERTQLAAAIPSFIKLDSAMRDPVVRRRLTAPLEKTQPDVRLHAALKDAPAPPDSTWLLRFEDANGITREIEATTGEILNRLRAGAIPVNAQAARPEHAKFKPLVKWPVFAESVATIKKRDVTVRRASIEPAPEPRADMRAWWYAGVALGLVTLGSIVAVVWVFFSRA